MRISLSTGVAAVALLAMVSACSQGGGEAPEAPKAAPPPANRPHRKRPSSRFPILTRSSWSGAEAEPDEGAPPLTVKLIADISGGVGERTVKWDFGDGSPPSSEENPTHTYEKAGSFRASVDVSDTSGDSDSDYVDIEVGEE